MALTQQLLTNKTFANQVKYQVPEFYQKLQSIDNKQKEKALLQNH